MADRVGQQLGNYRLSRLIGQGGFANVYLGEHTYLKTQAAIKVLQTRVTDDELQAFLKEAQTIASLHLPCIIDLILLPILLVIYNTIVERRKRV